jgi:hypothetical protein
MKWLALGILAICLSLLPRVTNAEPDLYHWGSFTVSAYAATGFDFEVEILSDKMPGYGRNAYVKLVRTQHILVRQRGKFGTRQVKTWTDSNLCPVVLERLSALKTMEAPHIDPFGASTGGEREVDGDRETIEAPGLFGPNGREVTIRLSADNDPSMGQWIRSTMDALKPCWKPIG